MINASLSFRSISVPAILLGANGLLFGDLVRGPFAFDSEDDGLRGNVR
jgi:hypothetical protein